MNEASPPGKPSDFKMCPEKSGMVFRTRWTSAGCSNHGRAPHKTRVCAELGAIFDRLVRIVELADPFSADACDARLTGDRLKKCPTAGATIWQLHIEPQGAEGRFAHRSCRKEP